MHDRDNHDNHDHNRHLARSSDGKWQFLAPPQSDGGPREQPPLIRPPSRGQFRFSIWYIVLGVMVLLLVNSLVGSRQMTTTVDYSTFKSLVSDGQIKRVRITDNHYVGLGATEAELTRLRESGSAAAPVGEWRTVRVEDPGFVALLDDNGVQYFADAQGGRPLLGLILQWVVPLGLMFLVWRFMFKRLGSMGSNVMAFGKSRAQVVAEGETGVRFADVAGADEAKAELEEVVDFLGSPERYVEIGGKIPKGVLLVGAPGTGKTLLARAVAGEAGVTFFRLNGADFVEMFVGVGAARVRDLFKQAREKSPCIIFIDELDAIGKSRGVALAGGNDEREQTLNQLLVEMDGFDARSGVIILGATNRPEVLDAALLRPGRFDRQVLVDKPDLTGREAILKIHSAGVKLEPEVDLREVARATPGFAGADLANIVNEAALLAVRARRKLATRPQRPRRQPRVLGGDPAVHRRGNGAHHPRPLPARRGPVAQAARCPEGGRRPPAGNRGAGIRRLRPTGRIAHRSGRMTQAGAVTDPHIGHRVAATARGRPAQPRSANSVVNEVMTTNPIPIIQVSVLNRLSVCALDSSNRRSTVSKRAFI